jgi:hypothetical protein
MGAAMLEIQVHAIKCGNKRSFLMKFGTETKIGMHMLSSKITKAEVYGKNTKN